MGSENYEQVNSSDILEPSDIWSADYVNHVYPWGGDERVQFKQYHDYFTMRDRLLQLADQNSDIMSFHEGLNGGTNARGDQTTSDNYEGWYYGHSSPWVKITGAHEGVNGGDCNDFNGDCGNYEDIPDIQLVGNHHAREWMSYEVPMFFLETLLHAYGNVAVDNDGDGLYDEDGWGDVDGDGILDDDGDCLALDETFQDSNGDGILCGPGDLGVDEDYSEVLITQLVDTREIYLIPMLNVDGNRYDREVYCGETAWENCRTSGWRKNLRDNTVTGVTPVPDVDEEPDPSCDGVDLNRNYQFEWGAPLGATGPLFPGMCYAGEAGANNDVYNGPVNTNDEDDDGKINEDHVDGKDDDADGLIDEDWMGGNSEPETRFIQDLTEMNDDDDDGSADTAATLTWHSFSELVLYPWGHCQDCETPDHNQLIWHGDQMAEMTLYENMQSSDLYPTTGDYCDWQYGVHDSYCYTIEIGTAFHQSPDEIGHIAVRNVGVPFYMIEIADNPRVRANAGIAKAPETQHLTNAENLTIPEFGSIPIEMCLHPDFKNIISFDINYSYVEWRIIKPTRQQTDFGPKEWADESIPWESSNFIQEGGDCILKSGENGTTITSKLPVPSDFSGKLQYKSVIGTLDGTFPYSYPYNEFDEKGNMITFYEIGVPYRAPYGDGLLALLLFCIVAGTVWGSLGLAIRKMNESGEESILVAETLD